jgi:hypothetical protein
MKISALFGRRRPSPRKVRRQADAIRAKTERARRQVAATDAMLASQDTEGR